VFFTTKMIRDNDVSIHDGEKDFGKNRKCGETVLALALKMWSMELHCFYKGV
jgi:hypothetical protein